MRQAEIAQLLPSVFRRTIPDDWTGVLAAVLGAMETLHAPSEDVLDGLDVYFSPRRTPIPEMVPALASWIDLEHVFVADGEAYHPTSPALLPAGLGWLRELVARGAWLAAWTGTTRGLLFLLETVTGTPGFSIDDTSHPFHLVIGVPAGAASQQPLVQRVVAYYKPAYCTFELEVAP
jgi:phage tail-like protein